MMSPVPQPDEERDRGPNQDSEDNELGEVDVPNIVMNQGNSDSEDDNNDVENTGYHGYQMLSQDGVVEEDSDSSEDEPPILGASNNDGTPSDGSEQVAIHQGLEPNSGANLPSYMQVPDLPLPDPKQHLWNTSQSLDIEMDDGQVDTIKAAMTGFELPSKNIPDWAREITEDQWKDRLLSSLKTKKS